MQFNLIDLIERNRQKSKKPIKSSENRLNFMDIGLKREDAIV